MFGASILQNRWVLPALLLGGASLLALVLTYLLLWRSRDNKTARRPVTGIVSFLSWLFAFVPWILILTYAGTLFYMIFNLIYKAGKASHW